MKTTSLINVSKTYQHPVLINIDYTFEENSTYLIVGENGSGKSTLIKLIIGLIKPSNGYISKVTKKTSYVPDVFIFPEFLKIKDFFSNLLYLINYPNKISEEEILDSYKLWDLDKTKKMNELSKGMRQKVVLIQAFLNEADLYIFDEPLNGLDKNMRDVFFKEIKRLQNKKKTIIIISHEITAFDGVYNYKLEIKDGRIV